MKYRIVMIDIDGNESDGGYIAWSQGRKMKFETSSKRLAQHLNHVNKQGYVNFRIAWKTKDAVVDGVKKITLDDPKFIEALDDGLGHFKVLTLKPEK